MQGANVGPVSHQAHRLTKLKGGDLLFEHRSQAAFADDDEGRVSMSSPEVVNRINQKVESLFILEPADRANHRNLWPKLEALPHLSSRLQ